MKACAKHGTETMDSIYVCCTCLDEIEQQRDKLKQALETLRNLESERKKLDCLCSWTCEKHRV
jgi:hypothetical protein